MKKRSFILAALTLTGLLLMGCTDTTVQDKPSNVNEEKNTAMESQVPENVSTSSELSEADAKKIALEQVPGAKESDIREFEADYDDGRFEYEGSIWYNEIEYEFEIDGYSGEIRSWEEESIYD